MIAKSYIRRSLRFCQAKYSNAAGKMEALAFSKLAVLELCGWIEDSIDDIVLKCANRHLKSHKHTKFIKSQVVERTYGFEYDRHFRAMLVHVFGLVVFERIEISIDPGRFQKFKSALGELKVERDRQAHTYLKGVTIAVNAPSKTISLHADVEAGLLDFERAIKAY